MAFFESTKDFDKSISEVDFLLDRAKSVQGEANEFTIYVKASIILLTAKIEAFSENILEEFVRKLAEKKFKPKFISKDLRIHATTFLLKDLVGDKPFSAKEEAISALVKAAALWNEDLELPDLPVNPKFDFGKHGSKQFKKFFSRIGVVDICEQCQISSGTESLLAGGTIKRNISADIDSITNIRNNIIHTDSSPASLTYQQIEEYRETFWQFCYLIDKYLFEEFECLSHRSQEP